MEKDYADMVKKIIYDVTKVSIENVKMNLFSEECKLFPADVVYVFCEIEKRLNIPINNFYKAGTSSITIDSIARGLELAQKKYD